MPKHLIGSIWVYFVMFYFVGIYITSREKAIAKHKLPTVIERILFLCKFNTHTINTIIYQMALILTTMVTLVICYFDLVADKQDIYTTFMRVIVALLIMEGVFIWKVNKIEDKESKELGKRNKEIKKMFRAIKKAKKSGNETELAVLKQRVMQLYDLKEIE